MLQRASHERWSNSQGGQNKPDKDFFESDHFQLLELTLRRGEESFRKTLIKTRIERNRRRAVIDRSTIPEIGYYSQLYRADGNQKQKKPRTPRQTFFGLRRPLSKQEQRVVTAMPCWERSFQEWVDKPFSTVYHGFNGYSGQYPLLMQVNSESEDKDVTVIQTETRRKSLVTTNYADGTIKLEGEEDKVCFAVFPILHVVIESDESGSGDGSDYGSRSGEHLDGDSTPRNRPPPLLPQDVLQRLTAIAEQGQRDDDDDDDDESDESLEGPPPGWLENQRQIQADRRLSITTRPCPEKPRMLKRRSLDYGSLFYHHEVDNMEAISEDGEAKSPQDSEEGPKAEEGLKVDEGPKADSPVTVVRRAKKGTWLAEAAAKMQQAKGRDLTDIIRRAEREMELMETNLHKLEEFLRNTDSDDSDE